jgi:hypothetical protein
VVVEHRIEDMVQVSDVQINGQLAFTRQVTHAYPYPGSFISSALVAQDLKARVSVFFDQATWDSVTYADAVTGSVAPGTYNDILAPLDRDQQRGGDREMGLALYQYHHL